MTLCPFCEIGTVEPFVADEVIRYAGHELTVPGIQLSRCPHCGEEMALPEQAKLNEVTFADAKRKHDGLLTSREIRAWRSALRLTQAEAASLFGGGPNAFSKYERGEVIQSKPLDILMRATSASLSARHAILLVAKGEALPSEPKWSRVLQSTRIGFAELTEAPRMVGQASEYRVPSCSNDEQYHWKVSYGAH